jgi:hypothetical protein
MQTVTHSSTFDWGTFLHRCRKFSHSALTFVRPFLTLSMIILLIFFTHCAAAAFATRLCCFFCLNVWLAAAVEYKKSCVAICEKMQRVVCSFFSSCAACLNASYFYLQIFIVSLSLVAECCAFACLFSLPVGFWSALFSAHGRRKNRASKKIFFRSAIFSCGRALWRALTRNRYKTDHILDGTTLVLLIRTNKIYLLHFDHKNPLKRNLLDSLIGEPSGIIYLVTCYLKFYPNLEISKERSNL